MPYAICPGCDAEVDVSGNPRLGREIRCPECDGALVVVNLNPLELDWTEEEKGDLQHFEDEDQ